MRFGIKLFIFLGIFCVGCVSQTRAQNDIFVSGWTSLGIIGDNGIQFYHWSSGEKTFVEASTMPDVDVVVPIPLLALPEQYDHVFGMQNGVGVVLDNNIQFYGWDRRNNSWAINHILNFTLPDGYDHIFGNGSFSIGIVGNNVIRFYLWDWESDLPPCLIIPELENVRVNLADDWENGSWEHIPDMDFSLPNGYTYIVGIQFGLLGIITNNRLQFYEFNGANNSWSVIPDVDLILPNGFNYSFDLGLDIPTIGVVINDRIQIFQMEWENNSWVSISSWRVN